MELRAGLFFALPICLRSIFLPSSRPRLWMPSCPTGLHLNPALLMSDVSSRAAPESRPPISDRSGHHQTEWILLTSGTTGLPKMVVAYVVEPGGGDQDRRTPQNPVVWSTFYDIRRYGGLQIFLRALLGGGSLVLSSAQESTGDFLIRAGARGVTHISGTPSHWRRALMSPSARRIAPQYVRLSGEIADQAILDKLRAVYPGGQDRPCIRFDRGRRGVRSRRWSRGLSCKPDRAAKARSVEMKVEDGSLRIRSARTAIRYLGSAGETLADKDGFVDTGDMVELRGDRYYFVGRRDGIINVGGLKVHPEEVEAVINRHPSVQMSLVKARRNPLRARSSSPMSS